MQDKNCLLRSKGLINFECLLFNFKVSSVLVYLWLYFSYIYIYIYIYPILLGVQKLNLVFYLRCICVLRCWFNLRVLVAPMKIRDAARTSNVTQSQDQGKAIDKDFVIFI